MRPPTNGRPPQLGGTGLPCHGTVKSYVRSIPFSEKDDMVLKLSALRVLAFAECAQKSEKTIMTLWILSTKNVFLIV